jgi:hypothetical protein
VTAALLLWLAWQPPAPPETPPAPAPTEAEPPKRYGDQGTSHFGLALGLGGGTGGFRWAGGLDYGYFVFDGIAPGVDTLVSGGSNQPTTGLILGTLRLVPIRTSSMSVFLIGRAGRVLIVDHRDGWAAGGGGGIIFFTGGRVGILLGYEILRLLPSTFCDDLRSKCTIQGLSVGIVAGF